MKTDSVILETRSDAELVLEHMTEIVKKYGHVSRADLYDLTGISPTFVDEKWGWKDLSNTTIDKQDEGGYLLNLPQPVTFD